MEAIDWFDDYLIRNKIADCSKEYYEALVSQKLFVVIRNGMLAGDQLGLCCGGSYLMEIKGKAVENRPDLFDGEYVIRNHMNRKDITIADFNSRSIKIKNKARLVYEWNDFWETNENIFLINKSIYLYLEEKGVQTYDSFLLWKKRYEGTFDFADYLTWLVDKTGQQIKRDDLSEHFGRTIRLTDSFLG